MELSLNTETCRENVRPGDSRMTSSASRLWEHCFFQTRSIPTVLPVATFLNFNNLKKKRLKCEISHDMHVVNVCLTIPSKTCNRMTDSGQSVLQVENNGCFCSQFHILFIFCTLSCCLSCLEEIIMVLWNASRFHQRSVSQGDAFVFDGLKNHYTTLWSLQPV